MKIFGIITALSAVLLTTTFYWGKYVGKTECERSKGRFNYSFFLEKELESLDGVNITGDPFLDGLRLIDIGD